MTLRGVLVTVMMLIVVLAVLFFGVAPKQFDKMGNRVDSSVALSVRLEALKLHRSLTVADLHADPLLWRRDFLANNDYGHVDLPRLERGNVALQVFAAVTKVPMGQNYDANSGDSDKLTPLMVANMQPVDTWTSLYQRALYQVSKLKDYEAAAPDRLKMVRSRTDLVALLSSRKADGKPVGAIMALEGAHAIEGRMEYLDGLYEAGYRVFGLAHFFDNEVAGSMHGMEKHGLTELGRQAVARAEELGMVIDLAHASAATISDTLDIATRPVIVSHGGVRATCDVNRNLTDDQILRVADNGGLIGVGYWAGAVCDISTRGIVRAMLHIRDLVGVSYIGLGSDFDGFVTTGFDTSQLAGITQALMNAGFSENDIADIMGGNATKLFYQVLP